MSEQNKTTREQELRTALIGLRAYVVRMAGSLDDVGQLPARQRGPEAARLAERMRNAVMEPNLVELCK